MSDRPLPRHDENSSFLAIEMVEVTKVLLMSRSSLSLTSCRLLPQTLLRMRHPKGKPRVSTKVRLLKPAMLPREPVVGGGVKPEDYTPPAQDSPSSRESSEASSSI